jgi:hypothetical protein
MKEDWTKQMKQKLEGHQMDPPAGLWESISNEMQLKAQSAPASAPAKTVSLRRWYWIAAAAIVTLVGFFTFYQFDSNKPQLVANHEKAITTAAASSDAQPSMPQEAPTLLAQVAPQHSHTKISGHQIPTGDYLQAATSDNLQEAPAENLQEPTESTPQDVADNHQPAPDDTPILVSNEKKQTYLPEVFDPMETRSKSGDSDKWTIGLNGSNGLLMASNNLGNSMGNQLLNSDAEHSLNNDAYYDTNGLGFVTDHNKYKEAYTSANLFTLPDVVSKHKLPMRLGLSLQYQLSNRIALHSGISYTYLESEFIMPLTNSDHYTQKLRYIGIPLGASWNLWSTGNLHIYLTGTALIEKCIKAEATNGDVDEQPWQFSLNAAAGAEYNITRQFGLYLEPALGYYFNDGTSLQHYYKEHPLAPSIQFGLRLHLK